MPLVLCLGKAGTGKTHWLQLQNAAVVVDCTNKSHRAVLCALADALGLEYPTRASIDDLLTLLTTQPPTTIALDNIDRAPIKACYSVLALARAHTVFATATDRKRIRPILDRHAARLVSPPPCNLSQLLADRYPDLPPATRLAIAATAPSPAAAIAAADAARSGTPAPTPQPTSLLPLAVALAVGLVYLFRWHADNPLTYVALSAAAILVRRLLWRR